MVEDDVQLFAIVAFMIVLPISSILVEVFSSQSDLASSATKWFVFWSVGARLFSAGIRQVTKPEFTAKEIFEIGDPAASKLVVELGFGNLAIGLVGLLSLWFSEWIVPAAVAGALFFGLAGIQHVRNRDLNSKEKLAMWSDLYIAAVLAACLIALAV
jgi:hypothetical protein